jgi:hypothetical protein
VFLSVVQRYLGPIARLKDLRFFENNQSLETSCYQVLEELFAKHRYPDYQTGLICRLDWEESGKPIDSRTSHPNYIGELFLHIKTALDQQDESECLALLRILPTLLRFGLENFHSSSFTSRIRRGDHSKDEQEDNVSFSLFIEFMGLICRSGKLSVVNQLRTITYSILHESMQLLLEYNVYHLKSDASSKQRIQFFAGFCRDFLVSNLNHKDLEDPIAILICDLLHLDHRFIEEYLDRILRHYWIVSDIFENS